MTDLESAGLLLIVFAFVGFYVVNTVGIFPEIKQAVVNPQPAGPPPPNSTTRLSAIDQALNGAVI